jgi:hypothetical protein
MPAIYIVSRLYLQLANTIKAKQLLHFCNNCLPLTKLTTYCINYLLLLFLNALKNSDN